VAPAFGCETCFGESAERAWGYWRALARHAEIVRESHFDVIILGCGVCGQRFASVFCETIDWTGGADPQDCFLIPLTASEAEALVRAGEDGVESALRALAPGRRFLLRSFPREAAEPEVRWLHGPILLPRHD
jgi:hypothetical protein